MTYFAIINNVKVGPLRPEELVRLGMGRDTLVWREGMTEWMPAWRLPELDAYFYNYAPGAAPMEVGNVPCPPTHLVWAILVTIFCCQIFGIVAIVYSAQVESRWSRGDYAGAKKASSTSLTWILVSIGAGFLCAIVYFILQLLAWL